MTQALPPLPAQPAGVSWPTADWPTGPLPKGVDQAGLSARLDFVFSEAAKGRIGETHALLVIQGGRLLAERYADGFGPDSTCWSWSMAKSVTHALVGIAVGDGLIDLQAPADVPEWREEADDPRASITLDLLLRMSSGLAFVENYTADGRSDVREMLWGHGRPDTAAFAAAFPLEHAPGGFFSYSSGTSNIVSRCIARAIGAKGEAFAAFMRERLFEPIGMRSPIPKFDAAGTFIGSSFCFATPRDFARFGLLYLRGGVWDGRRILPDGWVDYARTPTWQQPEFEGLNYGAHWWLGMAGPGTFSANGFDGQHVILDPASDLIVVRHGVTPEAQNEAMRAGLGEIVAGFR